MRYSSNKKKLKLDINYSSTLLSYIKEFLLFKSVKSTSYFLLIIRVICKAILRLLDKKYYYIRFSYRQ